MIHVHVYVCVVKRVSQYACDRADALCIRTPYSAAGQHKSPVAVKTHHQRVHRHPPYQSRRHHHLRRGHRPSLHLCARLFLYRRHPAPVTRCAASCLHWLHACWMIARVFDSVHSCAFCCLSWTWTMSMRQVHHRLLLPYRQASLHLHDARAFCLSWACRPSVSSVKTFLERQRAFNACVCVNMLSGLRGQPYSDSKR